MSMVRIRGAVRWLIVGIFVVTGAVSSGAGDIVFQDRYHDDHRSTPKLVFHPEVEIRGVGDAEGVSRVFLEQVSDRYRLPSGPDDLILWKTQQSLLGSHFRYRQLHRGIPVEGAEIVVTVDQDLNVSKVFNNVYPVTEEPVSVQPNLASEEALDIAWDDLRVHGPIMDGAPEAALVWMPDGSSFRLVWRTQVNVEAPFGRWRHRVDAMTGEILSVERTELPRRPYAEQAAFDSYQGPTLDRAEAVGRFVEEQRWNHAKVESVDFVDGSGLTFDPDPRTTLMNDSLRDNSSPSSFNDAYFTRILRDITESGGTYSLVGPYVTIANFESPNTAPSTTPDGIWTAVRGNNAFNDSMTYFHIDQNQRYMQALGFVGATGIQDGSIWVDTDGLSGADNSHYVIGSNRLAFGHGCVDDNEDVDVILHEYMHAITHDINPSWGGGHTGAIGEGLGDYWAGSYSYSTPNGPDYHPAWAFTWDGQLACWPGRDMDDYAQNYNAACSYGAHSYCGSWNADQLWSTCMFSSLTEVIALGRTREEFDQIVLEGQFGLGYGVTIPELADATLVAAQALYPGSPHAQVLYDNFVDHNIPVSPINLDLIFADGFESGDDGAW